MPKKIKAIDRFLGDYYLDTSSINKLAENLSIGDCLATRKSISEKNKRWIISPLNLYEVLNTSDPNRREELIHKISHLFPQPGLIFDTPSRILFAEILGYLPSEHTDFEKGIRKTWFDVVSCSDITFTIDYEDFRNRRNLLHHFTSAIKFILKIETLKTDSGDHLDDFTRGIIEYLKINKPSHVTIERGDELGFYISQILVLLIFCFGVEPDMKYIDEFWNKEQIENDLSDDTCLTRFIHICGKHGAEILNSPQMRMMVAYIMFEHKSKGINRGTLSDALHLIYASHCGFFITDDEGIISFAQQYEPLKNRVLSVRKDGVFVGEHYLGRNPFRRVLSYLNRFFTKSRLMYPQ